MLRPTCKSALFVQMINTFGANGGFEDIMRVIQTPETSLDHVFYLTSMLANSQRMYHKSFVDRYFARLSEAVEHKLTNAPEAQLRAVRHEATEKMVDHVWSDLMVRLLGETQLRVAKSKLQVKLGIMLLQEKFGLEKRIEGAKMIDSVCKRALTLSAAAARETVSAGEAQGQGSGDVLADLIHMLRVGDVVELFFSRKNIHSQLVQRSESLLKLLITAYGITDEELQMVWANCSQDEAMGLDLYTVVKNFSAAVEPGQLTFFIDMIALKPTDRIRGQELELMQHLANQSTKAVDPEVQRLNQAKVMEFLWKYLFDKGAEK